MKRNENNPGGVFWLVMTAARGLAGFVAVYTLLSLLALALGNSYNQNTWWIDLGFLPTPLGPLMQLFAATLLLAFTLKLPKSRPRRWLTAAICAVFAIFALQNVLGVYAAERAGEIRLGSPVPFSLFIAFGFVILTLAVLASRDATDAKPPHKLISLSGIVLTVMITALLFPSGQIFCFGTTDYRDKMDAAVVLGAQVLPDKSLSLALRGRVDTACELYEQGLTPILIMSGGTDIDGVNEALAMKDYAIAKGIPEQAILVDTKGMNTQATVRNTLEIIRENGYERVAAVSSFYHLARIKMLYLSEGFDVLTVPAQIDERDRSTSVAAMREIPGWWYYWLGGVFGW